MTARDEWVRVNKDGSLTLCSELDGWSYMKAKDKDRREEPTTLEELDAGMRAQAIGKLESDGFVVNRTTLKITKGKARV